MALKFTQIPEKGDQRTIEKHNKDNNNNSAYIFFLKTSKCIQLILNDQWHLLGPKIWQSITTYTPLSKDE